MKIGELARKAGCPVETIRYYERERLLHTPLRDQENNYRHYNNSHLERLLFIRRCRSLDMTHDEIRSVLQKIDHNDRECTSVDDIIKNHLIHVQRRIEELKSLEKQLIAISELCPGERSVEECGIVMNLVNDAGDMISPPTAPVVHLSGTH
ncbi:Cd(II)/Pb(II)-responsive transcriptional regulator [Salmonella enterica]|nr:Cd(II)/Pb(II)-responsive transcriptional regulator [Salmonella enterica subsp. enterica serovar Newport]EKT1275007.1 Cd(II)/Pb(II)-responsive transcriptional regulator [Salmonella enterica]EGM3723024.1 Cd(II)/Pb(II)-responsive transcriptional regulator [Salmonella enterica subsp. enterica serovar Newport]EKT1784162.1 Cd(II)/Pb(II)-responsive transcriptional regulator [Salmonella enterica]EKT2131357.1 Cd(II)/Pb(II)-responsive transcriptional regulator [Salmonella enterica]